MAAEKQDMCIHKSGSASVSMRFTNHRAHVTTPRTNDGINHLSHLSHISNFSHIP